MRETVKNIHRLGLFEGSKWKVNFLCSSQLLKLNLSESELKDMMIDTYLLANGFYNGEPKKSTSESLFESCLLMLELIIGIWCLSPCLLKIYNFCLESVLNPDYNKKTSLKPKE